MSVVPVVRPARAPLAAVLGAGALVAVATGAYGALHAPAGRPLFTLGFSGMLQMKVWLATAAAVLLIVQSDTALRMWGRLGSAGRVPDWVPVLHRWSGTVAFVLTLPVAFHCLWALGFGSASPRVVLHGLAGCLLYGAFAAKMLALRLPGRPGLPGWALPVLGGTVVGALVLVWLTSVLWFLTRPGLPLL